MKLSEINLSFQRLLDSGGTELYEEKILRRWWGEREGLSLAEVVGASHVALSRIIWVFFHLPAPPLMAMHRASYRTALKLGELAEASHIYIDRRSTFALSKKGEWISGRISLGELTDAHRRAQAARADLADLARDPQERLFAKAFCEVSSHNVESALRNFHYTIEEHPFAEGGELLRKHLLEAIQDEEVLS